MWFASRQPTTMDRCSYMSVSTGSASANRGRVPPLLYALPRSSSGLRSHGPEIGPMPKQGRGLQDPRWCRWTPYGRGYDRPARFPRREQSHTIEVARFVISTHLTLLLSVIVFISIVIWYCCCHLFCHFFIVTYHCGFVFLVTLTLWFDVGRPCVPLFARLFKKMWLRISTMSGVHVVFTLLLKKMDKKKNKIG